MAISIFIFRPSFDRPPLKNHSTPSHNHPQTKIDSAIKVQVPELEDSEQSDLLELINQETPEDFNRVLEAFILKQEQQQVAPKIGQRLLEALKDLSPTDESFHLKRAHIFKLNALYVVDDRVSDSLIEALQTIQEKEEVLPAMASRSYFEALLNSADLAPTTKYLYGAQLLEHVPIEDQADMLERLHSEVIPLIPSED